MIPGIHASVSGGLDRSLKTLEKYGLAAGQIFTTNQRQWNGHSVTPDEETHFTDRRGITILSHASYLINLASTKGSIREKSIRALTEELQRMSWLKIEWLVMHPGAHLGSGEGLAIDRVGRLVNEVLSDAPAGTGILLENTAGQGTSIGYTFQQLRRLLDVTDMPERTGICFDTCHAFAAGYDLSSIHRVKDTLDDFDGVIGLETIRAFHMNDSLRELGSRVDRHSNIGRGLIGLEPLQYLASMDIFTEVPGIVETPGSDEDRAKDASLLTWEGKT